MNSTRLKYEDEDNSSQIVPATGGISAVLGVTEMGPINDPSQVITTWEQFQRIYGGFTEATMEFALVVKTALDGGARLRVVNVRHYGDPSDLASLSATKAGIREVLDDTEDENVIFRIEPKYAGAKYNDLVFNITAPSNGQGSRGYFNIEAYISSNKTATLERYENLKINGNPTATTANFLEGIVNGSNLIAVKYNDLSGVEGGDTGGSDPANWAVTQTFVESKSANNSFVTTTLADPHPTVKFQFNGIALPEGLPQSMEIMIDGEIEAVVDYQTDYNGRPFGYTSKAGTYLTGVFKNGAVTPVPASNGGGGNFGSNIKPKIASYTFAGGGNGDEVTSEDFIGSPISRTGFHALDAYDDFFQFSAPTNSSADVGNAGFLYASNRQDVEYWHHLSNTNNTVQALVSARNQITVDTKYGAFYAGGALVKHPTTGALISISEIGHVMAIQAYVDMEFGTWISAAQSERGRVRTYTAGVVNNFGGFGLYNSRNTLANNQINLLIAENGVVRLSGNYSAQRDTSKASFHNVVRLIMYMKKSLRPTLLKYLEEPADFPTFGAIFRDVTPFLDDLATRRAFEKDSTHPGYIWNGDQDATSYDDLVVNNRADLALGKYKVLLTFRPLGSIIELTVVMSIDPIEGISMEVQNLQNV